MTEFKKGDRVSAWKMGNRAGKTRIIGTYQGTEPGGMGSFATVETADGTFKVRPGTLKLEGGA